MTDWIKFMGTAGARFVVSKQLRSSAGTWCFFQGKNILVDPGPGTLKSCFSGDQVLNPELLDAVILSHRHLDHSTDVNVIVEAMTHGTFNRRGYLFAPSDAVEKYEPVVFSHVRSSVEGLEILKENGSYSLDSLYFETPVRHDHPAETYGLKFKLERGTVSFITDTKYSPDLIDSYRGSDLLIMNVLLKEPFPDRDIKHLDLMAAQKIIEAIRPRLAVMTHFGLTMLNNNPGLLAEQVTENTGVKVVAAVDDLIIELDRVL